MLVIRKFILTIQFQDPAPKTWTEEDCLADLEFAMDEFFEGSEFEISTSIEPFKDELACWKKALYGVTPGMGSECIDDPEFCANRIRSSRESQMEVIRKQATRIKELEERR